MNIQDAIDLVEHLARDYELGDAANRLASYQHRARVITSVSMHPKRAPMLIDIPQMLADELDALGFHTATNRE